MPLDYGSVGVQLTRLRRLNQGTLTSICVKKNLNATVLQVTFTPDLFLTLVQALDGGGKRVSTAVVVLIFCI